MNVQRQQMIDGPPARWSTTPEVLPAIEVSAGGSPRERLQKVSEISMWVTLSERVGRTRFDT